MVPGSAAELAEALASATAEGRRVRPRGAGTKLDWGTPATPPDVELSTAGLDAIVEHNEGDFTAIVQPGLPLAAAQEAFGRAGQMLALDPPLGPGDAATIGGVVATGDSGPLRHRYLAPRDLVLGVQVALSDGTLARAGGRVIKNVAGYDLGKLLAGSFGTLGVITELSLRLQPKPRATATAVASGGDPDALAAAGSALAHRPLEPLALDLWWEGAEGQVLVRFGGATAGEQARAALAVVAEQGLDGAVVEDDPPLWDRQRQAQRSSAGTVVRVSATQTRLPAVLAAARRRGARVVARAGLGLAWLTLPEGAPADVAAAVIELRDELAPSPCVVLDAPAAVREALDPWGALPDGVGALMARVRERFDPPGTLRWSGFAGGVA